jgi:hypothetical protein
MVAAVASVFFGEAAAYTLTAVDATNAAPIQQFMGGTLLIVAAVQVRNRSHAGGLAAAAACPVLWRRLDSAAAGGQCLSELQHQHQTRLQGKPQLHAV